jgi:transcriptional regulator with XRE-family HTH domain
MKIDKNLSDPAVLEQLGLRLARRRLDVGLTQAALAEQVGLAKRTVERIERGESAQLISFVRLLRGLDLIDGLELALPDFSPSPMTLLAHRGRERKRVRAARPRPPSPWHWREQK